MRNPDPNYVHTRADYDIVLDGENYGPILVRGWSDDPWLVEKYNAGESIWCKQHGWEPTKDYPYPEVKNEQAARVDLGRPAN